MLLVSWLTIECTAASLCARTFEQLAPLARLSNTRLHGAFNGEKTQQVCLVSCCTFLQSCPSAIICLQALSLHAFFFLARFCSLVGGSVMQTKWKKKKLKSSHCKHCRPQKYNPQKKAFNPKKSRVDVCFELRCLLQRTHSGTHRKSQRKKKKAKSHSLSLFFFFLCCTRKNSSQATFRFSF
jgi:hypothetical protein